MKPSRHDRSAGFRWQPLIPVVIGIVAFVLTQGPKILDPRNIAWLGSGDPATHYLGWVFYRHGEWHWPIGLNPDYGLGIGGSILFSDSNPLLAMLFKPLSPWLSEPFQYFGLWLFACFVLQSWFAWKLAGIATTSPWAKALACALFTLSPPMLARMQGHLSLGGHFFVLAALYLCLRPDQRRRAPAWIVLLVCAAMIHAYLFAMIFALWAASWVSECWRHRAHRDRLRPLFAEVVVLSAALGLTFWQVGYFSLGKDVWSTAYGFYKANLLTFVDSDGWSAILRDLPEAKGDYEGFNFLGLGGILLLLFAVPIALGSPRVASVTRRRLIPLGAALALLFVFAVTNHIGIGSTEYRFDLPDDVLEIATLFRSSGRMMWPVFYAILFASLFMVMRGYRQRTATTLLAIVVIAQAVDTRAGWQGRRQVLMQKSSSELMASPLKDPFWVDAARQYRMVRLIEPGNVRPQWQAFAHYAATNHLATDAVYLARTDTLRLEAEQRAAAAALASGRLSIDTLYILDDSRVAEAQAHLDFDRDLLTRIDGFNVLAPGWQRCSSCAKRESSLRPVAAQ